MMTIAIKEACQNKCNTAHDKYCTVLCSRKALRSISALGSLMKRRCRAQQFLVVCKDSSYLGMDALPCCATPKEEAWLQKLQPNFTGLLSRLEVKACYADCGGEGVGEIRTSSTCEAVFRKEASKQAGGERVKKGSSSSSV
eukprot:1145281-Pelagomonas_calceolata.AAC.3